MNMSDHVATPRFLLEFRSINEDGLRRIEQMIFLATEAECWLFHDK